MNAGQLRQMLVLANEFKEGDLVVGGTRDDRVRVDARGALLGTTVGDIRRTPIVEDGVTEALARTRDRTCDGELDLLTIAEIRDSLLGRNVTSWLSRYAGGLSSEVIAAVAKVMTNSELSHVARRVFNPHEGSGITTGSAGHFGSRLQPNSPGDDEEEILLSVLDGLSYGCGDVILGVNPASDDLDTIVRLERLLEQIVIRLELPTRYCVLSDIVKQDAARQHTRVDVGFQSLAGTSRALAGMVGLDVEGILDLARGFDGLYFETGQGSAVTNDVAEGVDMVTLESRAYGVARLIQQGRFSNPESKVPSPGLRPWMIVNDVAGFIGPEVFSTGEQLERCCLEDVVMGKLHGLTMGLDVCATFHMGIAPSELRTLSARVVELAAPAYLMAVAGNADPMLGYMTTSFREHPELRRRNARDMTTVMRNRLASLEAGERRGEREAGHAAARIYAAYARAGGERRSIEALEAEGAQRLTDLRTGGFDVAQPDAAWSDARLSRIYTHARQALYAAVAGSVIRDATTGAVRVRTAAVSRDEYLARPQYGERVHTSDVHVLRSLYGGVAPDVQIVVSDGLNADAVNEQLRLVLPPLRRELSAHAFRVGDHDIVVTNGRVRVGYEIGERVNALLVVHLIGERPGTGLNTLSAYVTYGLDPGGRPRWHRALDHSNTNAICGIHPRGTAPAAAVTEIVRLISRMRTERKSGVALTASSARPL